MPETLLGQYRTSWPAYAAAVAVFALSFTATLVLPIPDMFRGVTATPGAVALAGLLLQLWRDDRAHQRKLELQSRQHDFSVGVASHMAKVAFDKQVAFCEAYMAKLQAGLPVLHGKGPCREALTLAADLGEVRFNYTTWIPNEVEAKLLPAEQALRKIGAAHTVLPDIPVGQQRTSLVMEASNLFAVFLGVTQPAKDQDRDVAMAQIVARFREWLGIEALSQLRKHAVDAAVKRLTEEG